MEINESAAKELERLRGHLAVSYILLAVSILLWLGAAGNDKDPNNFYDEDFYEGEVVDDAQVAEYFIEECWYGDMLEQDDVESELEEIFNAYYDTYSFYMGMGLPNEEHIISYIDEYLPDYVEDWYGAYNAEGYIDDEFIEEYVYDIYGVRLPEPQ